MPALSFKSIASSLKKAPCKLFKRSSGKTKMTISLLYNITVTTSAIWSQLNVEENVIDDKPEALTSPEILEHLRLGLELRLAAVEQDESAKVNQRSPKFVPKLNRIFELRERKPLTEVLGDWKSTVEVVSAGMKSSADEDLCTSSDSDASFVPSTPTSGRFSPLFDSASARSSPASSVSSLPLPAEHADIAKRLFTATPVIKTHKTDHRTTSLIPRPTLKSSTSTIGLGLGLALPQSFRSSAEAIFGPVQRPRTSNSKNRNIYLATLIPSPAASPLSKPRPSPRRFRSKSSAPLTSLPPRVFPLSRTRFGRVPLNTLSPTRAQPMYRSGRCGVPVRRVQGDQTTRSA